MVRTLREAWTEAFSRAHREAGRVLFSHPRPMGHWSYVLISEDGPRAESFGMRSHQTSVPSHPLWSHWQALAWLDNLTSYRQSSSLPVGDCGGVTWNAMYSGYSWCWISTRQWMENDHETKRDQDRTGTTICHLDQRYVICTIPGARLEVILVPLKSILTSKPVRFGCFRSPHLTTLDPSAWTTLA